MRREYIDMNGLADYPTLHGVINRMNPDQVICWHGLPQYREFFTKQLMKDKSYKVLVADENEHVEVMSEHNVMILRLDDKLKATANMQSLGESEVE